MSLSVGIDIAARSFELLVRRDGRPGKLESFEQTPAGHRRAVRRLQALAPEVIVMEATGIYYLDLAVALYEAKLPVCVVNPRSVRRFAELKLQHSKTDGLDAGLLAEYGERMQPRRWCPPASEALALRDIGRQINRLIKARTQAKNRLHALQATASTPRLLIRDEKQGIAQLDRRIDKLTEAARTLIQQQEQLAEQFAHITAAKGIREASGLALLAELCVLSPQLKSTQVSRHAGLDVRLNQSGSSIDKPGRLSKAGNAYLRAALFMPAMSAAQHDPHVRTFYLALLARGKKKRQAQCAVMRKYLTGLWACMHNGTAFDAQKLFSGDYKMA